MSKKLWICVVGLLALYAWGLTAILLWAGTIAPDAATKANVSILMCVSLVGAGLITLMWAVLSLVDTLDHSVRGHRASR